MNRTAYLSISCDADPDVNPPYRKVPGKKEDDLWQGILVGIPSLRRELKKTRFVSKYGQLPISWLLRCDRQICEVYGDASFCFRRFEKTWERERDYGSEIGWHPHLWKWDGSISRWTENLGNDDDIEILADCLNSLRQCAPIGAVRTGWVYHSNKLMGLFDSEGLLVDVSAIPGTVQSGTWYQGSHHDWRGTPAAPYFPSRHDYRRPAESREEALNILEMPVLVRRLALPLQFLRYGLRKARALRSNCVDYTDWPSSLYQGVLLTNGSRFCEAVNQTLRSADDRDAAFVNTYFHADDLLSSKLRTNLIRNLEFIFKLAEQTGWEVSATTLSMAAARAKVSLTQN